MDVLQVFKKSILVKLIEVDLVASELSICKGDSVHLVKNPILDWFINGIP